MLLGRIVMMPHRDTCSIVGVIPRIEQMSFSPYLFPKTLWGGGGGLDNTMSFSLVPKPLGGHAVVFS